VFGDEKLGFAQEEDFIKSLRQHGGEPHILTGCDRYFYDVVLNEINIQLSNLFGTDSWLLDFGVSYFGDYVKESGKFLFDKNMRCT
jgi:hypothetical protein